MSYHEAEILTRTLLDLKAMGVVAYGVYDCVVVKQSVRDAAVKTYRETVRSYVAQQHIAEQVFTYEELRTAANLYAAGLITSLPNAKANKVSLVQSNSSKYPQLLTVKIRCISSTVSLTGCFVP